MSKVLVVTDSASDIPEELRAKNEIVILPFTLTVDGKSYVERQDFTNEEYYEMLATCESIPTTAHITMIQFLDQFCKWADAGYTDVLYVSINSGGSNTYDAARMAAAQFPEERPESAMQIHIIDSHNYSMAYGWAVCQAAQKLKNGAAVSDVVDYLNAHFASVEVALSMYTLKFVKKSGRVSAAAAFAGELLGLRPVITIIDGETQTVSKVRGDANVMPALVKHMKERIAPGSDYLVASTDPKNGKMLAKLCKQEMGRPPACTFLLGAAVSTNTGPNAVALVFNGASRR